MTFGLDSTVGNGSLGNSKGDIGNNFSDPQKSSHLLDMVLMFDVVRYFTESHTLTSEQTRDSFRK